MASEDLSFKDKKYFIDGTIYNCPFCNRRNVKFTVSLESSFSWSNSRRVYIYIVRCSENECQRESFHMSDFSIHTYKLGLTPHSLFTYPPMVLGDHGYAPFDKEDMDDLFFFHQPTSFFTVDSRIPREIREPLSECENCRKSNFLTGASACLRKSIYKLLKHQGIPEKSGDHFIPYEERIDKLKEKFPKIEDEYFSGLKDVHGLTSQELHEDDWDDFDSKMILFLQGVTHQVLYEIYVLPDESIQRKSRITALKNKAFGEKKGGKSKASEEGEKDGKSSG